MDPRMLAMLIPITAILSGTYLAVVRIKSKQMTGSNPDTERRLADLEHEMGEVREELAQTQERLDFTERLLAKPK